MAAAAQREFERWKSFVGTMPTMSPPDLYTPSLDFLWPHGGPSGADCRPARGHAADRISLVSIRRATAAVAAHAVDLTPDHETAYAHHSATS
jgi:hypothetical protein